MSDLRFGNSVWCNIDVALRNVQAIYQQELEPLGITVIEFYILQTLYEQDGQMATQLATAVGRPATSFTPILDKLTNKQLVERQPHSADRRAIKVYLTKQGKALEERVMAIAERIETKLREQLSGKEWTGFERVISQLQMMQTILI